MTDITFFKKDWKLIMLASLCYMIANCVGSIALGHPLYPIADWKVPALTFMLFTAIGGMMSLSHIWFSWLT
jgi:hypothetical protein